MAVLAILTPESAGETFGKLIFLILLGAGAYKCWSISQRPTTNRKCALSLMFLVGAWLTFGVVGTFLSSRKELLPIVGLLSIIGFCLLITAVVLSIIGLVEYAQASGFYQQGRVQAISVLVLFGLFGAVVVIAAVSKAIRPGLPGAAAPGSTLAFEDFNFRVKAPGRPWVQADAARINPDARVAFIRSGPEMYFMVIAEKIANADLSVESLSELAQTRLKSAAESVEVVEKAQLKLGPLAAIRVSSDVRLSGKMIRYVQCFCATNGWAYQLMTWGKQQDAELVNAQAASMASGFALLDPARLSPPAARLNAVDFVSTNYGFAVRCSEPGWLRWEDQRKDCAYGSFGVLHQQDGALVVSAISLMDLEPEPEVVYRGMLSAAGDTLDEKGWADARQIRRGQLNGVEIRFDRNTESGRTFSYRVQVLTGTNIGYLVAAWVQGNRPGKDKFLADALSRVSFLDGPSQVPAREQMSAAEKQVHRMMFNGIGLTYYERHRFDRSAQFFKEALALDSGEHDTPYLANFVDSCSRNGKYREAADALDQHRQLVDSQPHLRAREAYLQARLGRIQLALTNYSKLFEGGYTSEDDFREFILLLSQTEQFDRALSETEKYLERHDVPAVRLLQASLLKRQKRVDEALEMLQAQRKRYPFHAGIIYSLGDGYIAAGKASDALALCQQVLKDQGPSATFLVLKGRAELTLKWYRDAKKSFEQALKDSPDDPEIKSWLSAASGVLGQGANTVVKEPIEPVSIPKELARELPAPPSAFGAEDGAYYSRRIHAVSFIRGKELRTTEYVTVHPLNAQGVSHFSTFEIGFHPLSEDLYVNKLEVRNGSGELVGQGQVDDYYVLDDQSSGMATSRKVLHIPIPGLQPGYQIEAVFTRRELGSAKEFGFVPISFSRPFPVQEAIVYLCGDTNAVRWASSPALPVATVGSGLTWRCREPSVVRWEPLLPSVADYQSTLWLADANSSWTGLVSQYLEELQPRVEWPPDFGELGVKLVNGATNTQQKISAIACYVQSNYTYKAIEFGRRAREPETLRQILQHKYGDCKDHAVLVQQLLKAANVPSSLALASFNSPVREDLPSLDQFNHMIVHVPDTPQDWFIDCTSKSADLTAGWTLGLAGHTVLILDKQTPRLVSIPDYPTNASLIRLTRNIEFTNELDVLVNETLEFEGVHAAFLRSFLHGQSTAARRSYIAAEMVSPAGELKDFTIAALENPLAPLSLHIVSLVKGQFDVVGNQLAGAPVLGLERTFFDAQSVEKRRAPFEVVAPLKLERTINLRLPAGFQPAPASASEKRLDNEFVRAFTAVEPLNTGWRISSVLYEPAGRRAAPQYESFREALRAAVESLHPRLAAQRPGA